MLIDTGEDEDGEEILEWLSKRGIATVDHMIITHFDKDHVGGADTVLAGIAVSNLYEPDYFKEGKQYEQYVEAKEQADIAAQVVTEQILLSMGDVQILIDPTKEAPDTAQDNDWSLAISVTHGQNRMLFAGDAEDLRMAELMTREDIAHTLLKVPHHGKFHDLSEAFLRAVDPQYAIITCSDKNPESQELMEVLNRLQVQTYLTRNGDITITSDGNRLTIAQ